MPVPNPSLAYAITGSLKFLFLLGYLTLVRKRWAEQIRQEVWPFYLFEISLTLIMAFVIAQGSRVHYAILLAPAFVIMGLTLFRFRQLFGRAEKTLFLLGYALTGMVIPGGLLNRLPPHPVWQDHYYDLYLWMSLPFYGYMLLALSLVIAYQRIRIRSSP